MNSLTKTKVTFVTFLIILKLTSSCTVLGFPVIDRTSDEGGEVFDDEGDEGGEVFDDRSLVNLNNNETQCFLSQLKYSDDFRADVAGRDLSIFQSDHQKMSRVDELPREYQNSLYPDTLPISVGDDDFVIPGCYMSKNFLKQTCQGENIEAVPTNKIREKLYHLIITKTSIKTLTNAAFDNKEIEMISMVENKITIIERLNNICLNFS